MTAAQSAEADRSGLDERCRLAFLARIRDHEERTGRPLTDEELRRALTRYPERKDRPSSQDSRSER